MFCFCQEIHTPLLVRSNSTSFIECRAHVVLQRLIVLLCYFKQELCRTLD